MAAYLIARITVREPARYEEYRAKVPPVVAAHGGRYLVRGGAAEAMEGPTPNRIAVIEFPDMEAARAFYHAPDYAPLLRLRKETTDSEVVLVEGVAPPA